MPTGCSKPLIRPDLAAAPDDEAPSKTTSFPAITFQTSPLVEDAAEMPNTSMIPGRTTRSTPGPPSSSSTTKSTGHRGTWRPDVSETAARGHGRGAGAFDDVAEAAADLAEAAADDVAWSEAPASTLWPPPEGMGEEDWQAPSAGSTWEGMSEGWRETDDEA